MPVGDVVGESETGLKDGRFVGWKDGAVGRPVIEGVLVGPDEG